MRFHFVSEVFNHQTSVIALVEAELVEVELHGCVPTRQLLLFFTQLAPLRLLKHLAEDGRAQDGHGLLNISVQILISLSKGVYLLLLSEVLCEQWLDDILILLFELFQSLIELFLGL